MTDYAIVIVPQRRPFRYRFLANLSLPLLGAGGVGGQFTDDVENAVLVNRRNVALYLRHELALMHPGTDFMICGIKE